MCSCFLRQKQRTLLSSFGQRQITLRYTNFQRSILCKRAQHLGLSRHCASTVSHQQILSFPVLLRRKRCMAVCVPNTQGISIGCQTPLVRVRSLSQCHFIETDRVVALHQLRSLDIESMIRFKHTLYSSFQFSRTLQSCLQTDRICEISRVLSFIFLSNYNRLCVHRQSLNLTPIDNSRTGLRRPAQRRVFCRWGKASR